MKKLLIATTNPGKILEYKTLLSGLGIRLTSLKEEGISLDVEEDGKTFEENAIKKAKEYCAVSNLPVLADDGGLEIDYLNGKPGVKSRRWPGHEASDQELIAMTLTKLAGVEWNKRKARLKVVIALAFPSDNKIYTSEGVKEGYIRKNPLNFTAGYPFRSLFYLPELGKTYSEISMEEEAKIAHRSEALNKLMPILKNKLTTSD